MSDFKSKHIAYREMVEATKGVEAPTAKRLASRNFSDALNKAKVDTAKEDEKKKKVEEGKAKIVKSELLVSSNAQGTAVKDTKVKIYDDEH